ncbi:monovalent cation/H+ antiporter subunit D family protein [Aliiglaciecola sp. LCG003]|uniref:monovalent cation/H+ antiporter subunit D family protein n=1 Tax=Aliiglaciecola sp. LCG003 TaxID=3053655 RepID=UPI002573D748|nr:monovalent cation/H+ antiporter subunit D family protein [Aliiglaciecola sp. LCG003]WJG08218.1 monovalent cation/H+ antiporter subunit D family protein [Aliiglaciecola sp. LCG003]
MIEQNLTILMVVVPLMCAPITAMLNRAYIGWLITLLVTTSCFVMSIILLLGLSDGTVIHYELGGWAPPWGIEYRLDSVNGLVALIVSGIGMLTSIYAKRSVEVEIESHQIPLFYTAFQLCFLGLLGICLTGDIFNLFVFLEISSLASYALIALGNNRKALTASFHYLVLGTLGATFFLIGIGLAYAATGTLNMADLSSGLVAASDIRLVHTAFAFIIVGMALKAAIYPLHLWLPNAYSYAPSVVSIFLCATATKVAIYVIIRCLFNVFSIDYVLSTLLPEVLVVVGAVAILYGSVRAIGQNGMRKMLAYSSVAQIGYMVMGIGFFSRSGLTASLLHLFNHALMKAALFMAAGLFIYRVNTATYENLKGMGKEMPWTFAAMLIAAMSLIGVPGTVGFVSKWQLLQAAIEQQQWAMLVIIIIGSLLAIIYMWKLIEVLYFQQQSKIRIQDVQSGSERFSHSPLSMTAALWILSGMCIYFGIFTDFSMQTAHSAVDLLFAGHRGQG